MNQSFSAKWHRFENKYLVDEETAARIRTHCQAHLPLDPYSERQPDYTYPILSIYMDSPDLQLLQQTLDRGVERWKLRVRSYERFGEPGSKLPLFFEIKHKRHGIIYKTRSRVEREVGRPLVWDRTALANLQPNRDCENLNYLNEFLSTKANINARPTVGVFYTREAYESGGIDRVRVTFDTNLHFGLVSPPELGEREMWWPVETDGVILEIKFTNTFPFWIADMVRRGEVLRRGVCKYSLCSKSAGIMHQISA